MIGDGNCVLLVYDPKQMPLPLTTILEHEGYAVVQTDDGVQALSEMHVCRFDVIITDGVPSDVTRLQLPTLAHLIRPDIPVILFSSAAGDRCDLVDLRKFFAWVRKSSDPGILLSILALAMEQRVERESVQDLEMVSA